MHALSFISVLLAASIAVAEHGVGVTRTTGHARNAERFARGLPPLPPANLKQPTSECDQTYKLTRPALMIKLFLTYQEMFRALAPRASPGLCTSTKYVGYYAPMYLSPAN